MSFTYKGLEATYTRHRITDEELERQLEQLRRQTPQVVPVTGRGAENGDTVELDYAGFCDGEPFAGGTAEHQTLVLGSGTFIPGFEEQLLGCRPGDKVTVRVTFPRPYHAEHLAGKAAEFRCAIHAVTRQSPHELGDDFARALGLDSLEELRRELRKSLQDYADQRGQLDLEDRLMRQAAATLDFQPTEAELNKAVEEQMETLGAQLARQNLTMEMYCQFTGKSEKQLREDARPGALQALRLQAAVEEIARREQVTVTEEDVADALADICRQNHMTMEQLQGAYDEVFAAAVARSVRTRKVMALIREAAHVREEG